MAKAQMVVMLDQDEHQVVLTTLKAMHDLLVWILCQGRLSITGMADSWWHRGWTLGYESGKRDALSGELYSEACGRCRSRRCEGC